MSKSEPNAEQQVNFVVLGVHRRDLLFLTSTQDEAEARKVAEDGVLQSKFSNTFVFPVTAQFSESAVNWKNPDGVEINAHENLGAKLNPEAEEQESSSESSLPEVSKRDNVEQEAQAQIDDGSAIDTGKPDADHANKDGKPSVFLKKDATKLGEQEGQAKAGVQSSSDLKGTED